MSEEEPKTYQPAADAWESKPTDYDMDDSDEDLRRWSNLAPVLRDCRVTVVKAYHAADSAAMRYQRRHRRLVLVAAVCGALAVLFAIVQLYYWSLLEKPLIVAIVLHERWVGWVEFVAAGVAVVAVGFGLWAAFSSKWLLEREKAERYRLLKFRFLIHPSRWSGAMSEKRRQQLRDEMKPVQTLDEKGLEGWARGEGEVLELDPPEEAPADIDEAVLSELIDYYKERRLNRQQQYCARQASKSSFWERRTRFAPHWLFFLSIMAALLHFAYDKLWRSHDNMGPDTLSLTLILFAACFPVLGAAVRTWRAANEFGRNTLRLEATSNRLKRLASDLRKEDDPRLKLEILQVVERVLEVERREWLRLMKEAEWFG